MLGAALLLFLHACVPVIGIMQAMLLGAWRWPCLALRSARDCFSHAPVFEISLGAIMLKK